MPVKMVLSCAMLNLSLAIPAAQALADSPRKKAAAQYLQFLSTPGAQDAYAKYGFVKATPGELSLKAIP